MSEKMVKMPEQNIKSAGEYTVAFNLHPEIEDPSCSLIVKASEELAAADDDDADDDQEFDAEPVVEENAEDREPASEVEED